MTIKSLSEPFNISRYDNTSGGERIRFQLHDGKPVRLGDGSFGTIFLGRNESTEKEVAIKLFYDHSSMRPRRLSELGKDELKWLIDSLAHKYQLDPKRLKELIIGHKDSDYALLKKLNETYSPDGTGELTHFILFLDELTRMASSSAVHRFRSERQISGLLLDSYEKRHGVRITPPGLVEVLGGTETFDEVLRSEPFAEIRAYFEQQSVKISKFALVIDRYSYSLKELLERKQIIRTDPNRIGYDVLRELPHDLRVREAMMLLAKVADGLHELHNVDNDKIFEPLFHLDIKPGNIFIKEIPPSGFQAALGDLGNLPLLHDTSSSENGKEAVGTTPSDRDQGTNPRQSEASEQVITDIQERGTLAAPPDHDQAPGTHHYRSPEQKYYMDVADVRVEHLTLAELAELDERDSEVGLTATNDDDNDSSMADTEYDSNDMADMADVMVSEAVHNPRQRAYAGERKYVVLTVQDPKFKNTLIEPGDIVIFSKDTERHQRLITECRGGQRNSGYLAFKLSGQTDDPILSEEAKTQVEFYKKQRYRTDLFGIGAVVFDMITIGRSPEKFYESIRKFETTSVEDIVKRYDTLRRGEIEGENPDLSEIFEPFRHDNDPTKRYPDNDIVEFILKCMLYQSEGTFYEQNRADPGQASKALSDQMRDLLAEYKNKQLLPRQLIDSSILIDRPQNFGPPITGQSLQFDREIARLQGLDPWPDVEQLNEPALLAANRLRYGAYYFSQIVKLVRTKISSDNKSDETHLRQILPTYISLKRENGQATLDFEAAPSLQVRKELRDNRLEQLIRAPTNPFVPNWIASIRRDIRLFRSDPMARDSALSCKYRFRDASLFRLNIAAGDWVVCQGQLWQVMAPIEDDRLTIQFENTTADNKGIIWTKDGYADGTYFSALDPFKYYLDMLGLYLQHLIFTCSPLTTTTRDRLDIKALLYSLEIGPTIFINSPPAEFDDIAGGRLREILTNYVHLFLMLALHESPDSYYAHYLEELAQDNGLSDGSPDSDRLNRIGKRVLNWVDGYAKHQYAQILNLLNNSENSDDYPTTLKSLDNLPDDFKQMVDSLAQNRFDIEKTVKHSGLIAWSESFQPVMEPVTST